MILVPVCQDECADLVLVFDEIGKIGNDDINPVHFVVGKTEPAVDDEDITAEFVNVKILANLIETAKSNDFKFLCHERIYLLKS